MEVFILLLLVANIALTIDTRQKVADLDTRVRYGTIPSDVFPNDPRHKGAVVDPDAWDAVGNAPSWDSISISQPDQSSVKKKGY